MEQTTFTTVILTASEGNYIAKNDGSFMTKQVHLGKTDSPDNYHEVSEEEYNRFVEADMARIEAESKAIES